MEENLIGTTTTARKFGNRHGEREYPAGTLVEVLAETESGWAMCRVVGKRSIKGWVRLGTIVPA